MSLGFNVQEKRGKVSYSQKYANAIVYGKATKSEGDEFNVEQGKALAFARCDAMIRKTELANARRVRDVLMRAMAHEQLEFGEGPSAAKIYMRHVQQACEYVRILEKYYRNQKRIVKELEVHTFPGLTCKEILQKVHDIVCKNTVA